MATMGGGAPQQNWNHFFFASGVLTAFLLLLATACSGGTDQGNDGLQSATTDPAVAVTEATARSSTTSSTTPSTTVDPRVKMEESLLAFHQDYLVGTSTVDAVDIDADRERLTTWAENNMIDPQKTRLMDLYADELSLNHHEKGYGTISNVIDIDWNGSNADPQQLAETGATVTDCSLGRLTRVAADGTVLVDGANTFSLAIIDYAYQPATDGGDGRWLVKNSTAGDVCDPVDYLTTDGPITSQTDADQVLAVHQRFLTETYGGIDERVEGYDATLASAADTTTGTAAELIDRVVETNRDNGVYMDGSGYQSNVVALRVNGNQAAIVDCSLDAIITYDASGNPTRTPKDDYELRETFLKKVEGQWYVDHFWQRGNQTCNPDDYPPRS